MAVYSNKRNLSRYMDTVLKLHLLVLVLCHCRRYCDEPQKKSLLKPFFCRIIGSISRESGGGDKILESKRADIALYMFCFLLLPAAHETTSVLVYHAVEIKTNIFHFGQFLVGKESPFL